MADYVGTHRPGSPEPTAGGMGTLLGTAGLQKSLDTLNKNVLDLTKAMSKNGSGGGSSKGGSKPSTGGDWNKNSNSSKVANGGDRNYEGGYRPEGRTYEGTHRAPNGGKGGYVGSHRAPDEESTRPSAKKIVGGVALATAAYVMGSGIRQLPERVLMNTTTSMIDRTAANGSSRSLFQNNYTSQGTGDTSQAGLTIQKMGYAAGSAGFKANESYMRTAAFADPSISQTAATAASASMKTGKVFNSLRAFGISTIGPGGKAKSPRDLAHEILQKNLHGKKPKDAQQLEDTLGQASKIGQSLSAWVRSGMIDENLAGQIMSNMRAELTVGLHGSSYSQMDKLFKDNANVDPKGINPQSTAFRSELKKMGIAPTDAQSLMSQTGQKMNQLDANSKPFSEGLSTATQALSAFSGMLTSILDSPLGTALGFGQGALGGGLGSTGLAAGSGAASVAALTGGNPIEMGIHAFTGYKALKWAMSKLGPRAAALAAGGAETAAAGTALTASRALAGPMAGVGLWDTDTGSGNGQVPLDIHGRPIPQNTTAASTPAINTTSSDPYTMPNGQKLNPMKPGWGLNTGDPYTMPNGMKLNPMKPGWGLNTDHPGANGPQAAPAKTASPSGSKKKKATASASKATGTASKTAAGVIAIAKQYLGIPYHYGGNSPEQGFDCSGFTSYVFKKIGVSLPREASAQQMSGTPVDKTKARPGDLVFHGGSAKSGGASHVMLMVTSTQVIEAGSTGTNVRIRPLRKDEISSACRVVGDLGNISSDAVENSAGSSSDSSKQGQASSASAALGGSSLGSGNNLFEMDVLGGIFAGGGSGGGMGPTGASAAAAVGTDAAASGDTSGDGGSGAALAAGNSNGEKVFKTLIADGFTPQAAAGVLGNLMAESGVDPNSHQGGGGPGRGIMQWTLSERWQTLLKWAGKRDPWALDTQVGFMMKEMGDAGVTGPLSKMNNVNTAVKYFHDKMEGSADKTMTKRNGMAADALHAYGGKGYAVGSTNIDVDQDARVHQGEMIIPAFQADAVRKALTGNNPISSISGPKNAGGIQVTFTKDSIKVILGAGATTSMGTQVGNKIVDAIVNDKRLADIQRGF